MEENKDKSNANSREYKTDDLIVYWYPSLCSHATKCLIMLPQVFDVDKRPWVNINAAGPVDIMRTIDACPSGALRYALTENSKVDPELAKGPGSIGHKASKEAAPVKIRAVKDGPLLVKGPATLLGTDGTILREADSMVLCRCGLTKNPPFCDGEHRKKQK
ncbi:MAG: (4Fe-4S)-binding protein [Eubacteriales bacterium]|nr:(4Fe-4S)-binding protein [Eubacteriales bacterium]